MGVLVEAGLVPLCPCLADLGRPRSVVCPIRSRVRPGTRCSHGRRWCAVSRQLAAGVPVQAGLQLYDLQPSPHPSRSCLAHGGSGKAVAWIGAGVSQEEESRRQWGPLGWPGRSALPQSPATAPYTSERPATAVGEGRKRARVSVIPSLLGAVPSPEQDTGHIASFSTPKNRTVLPQGPASTLLSPRPGHTGLGPQRDEPP